MGVQAEIPRADAPIVFVEGLPESWVSRRIGPWAVGAALALAVATFVIFAGFTPIIPTTLVVLGILGGDGLVVVVLLVFIVMEAQKLRAARRVTRAGSRLHTRLVVLFSLVAAIPALFTAVIATVSVEWAINPAFMRNVSAFINESGASSQLYRESQCQALLRDAQLTASDLSGAATLLKGDRAVFQNYLDQRAHALNFSVAAVITTDGQTTIVSAGSDKQLIAKPNARDFADASAKQPFCGMLAHGDAFIALAPHRRLAGLLLLRRPRHRPDRRPGRARRAPGDRRLRQFRGAPAQHRTRLRRRLHHAVADAAHLGGLDRHDLRQPPRQPDPPAHPRRRHRRLRRFLGARADPQVRRRSRPSRRELQHDDQRIAPPAREPDRGQPAQRGAPRLHRGGAGGRAGGHRRARQERPHRRLQRRRGEAAGGRRRRADGPRRRRGVPGAATDSRPTPRVRARAPIRRRRR